MPVSSAGELPSGLRGNALAERAAEMRRSGASWFEVAHRLRLTPGRAYLVATGRPADGGHSVSHGPHEEVRDEVDSTQHLVNPPVHNPTVVEEVHAWMRRRAAAELSPAGKG